MAAVGGERFGDVHFESFPVGFSMPGLSYSYFVFLGDNVSERLVNRESPALPCFFTVAGWTFEYGSKLKLMFGCCILNSHFGILWSILGVCPVDVTWHGQGRREFLFF